jgi:hypothetical protein
VLLWAAFVVRDLRRDFEKARLHGLR